MSAAFLSLVNEGRKRPSRALRADAVSNWPSLCRRAGTQAWHLPGAQSFRGVSSAEETEQVRENSQKFYTPLCSRRSDSN